MFSSKYLTIIAKIQALVVTHCLFGTWLNLSDLSTGRELKARNSNIASFRVSVLTSLFSLLISKVSIHHLLRLFYVCLLLKRKNIDVFGKFLLSFYI